MSPFQAVIEKTRDSVSSRRKLSSHSSHVQALEALQEQVLQGLNLIAAEADSLPENLPKVLEQRKRDLFRAMNALDLFHKRANASSFERILTLLTQDIGIPQAHDRKTLHYEADEFHLKDLATFAGFPHGFSPPDLGTEKANLAMRALAIVKLDLVGIPASEVDNCLAWGLLYHEYMHRSGLPANLYISCGSSAARAISSIWAYKSELFTDLSALLVLGPAYGYALSQAPDKFGHHPGSLHPSAPLRFWLTREVLKVMGKTLTSKRRGNMLARELIKRAVAAIPNSKTGLSQAEKEFMAKAAPEISSWVKQGRIVISELGGETWDDALRRLVTGPDNYYRWQEEGAIVRDVPKLLRNGILPAAPPRMALNLALLASQGDQSLPEISADVLRSATSSAISRGSVLEKARTGDARKSD